MLASRVRMATFKDISSIPEGYVMATDDDFSGNSNGTFRYIGTDKFIIIPDVIKGVSVTSYASMFIEGNGKLVEGVISYNSNVTNMSNMFYSSQATSLDLSSFDTSNVTSMVSMFSKSQATSLDLSSFDTSNVTNMAYMFWNSQATTGYARTQADADKFNASSYKPAGLTFIVKQLKNWTTLETQTGFSGDSINLDVLESGHLIAMDYESYYQYFDTILDIQSNQYRIYSPEFDESIELTSEGRFILNVPSGNITKLELQKME